MGNGAANWLTGEFTCVGIPLQNWMLLAFAIILLAVALQVVKGAFDDRA